MHKIKRPISYFDTAKKRLLATAVFLLLVSVILPNTRYFLPSFFIKKPLSIILYDDVSNAPISGAKVSIDGATYTSNSTGLIVAKSKVGYKNFELTRMFYQTKNLKMLVGINKNPRQQIVHMHSSGRLAIANIKNRISGRAMQGIKLKTDQGFEAVTDSLGQATLVIAEGKNQTDVTASGNQILQSRATLTAAQDNTTNLYYVTPVGKVYFLSRASGNIDVVRTNLDGSDRQVAVAGTGLESSQTTKLLSSDDQKFVALKARREGELEKIYILDTSNDKLATIDDSAGQIKIIGWNKNNFIFLVERNYQLWQKSRQVLYSYDTVSGKTTKLDETKAEGPSVLDYAGEYIENAYILDEKVVYAKRWLASYYYGSRLASKQMQLLAVSPGSNGSPEVLKQWPASYYAYISTVQFAPNGLYVSVQLEGVKNSYYKYQAGVAEESNQITGEAFTFPNYNTYYKSPNGLSTFWSEKIDGQNSLFIGDKDAKSQKQILGRSDLVAVGWHGNDYLLVSKNNSELYIIDHTGVRPGGNITKITDFHGN